MITTLLQNRKELVMADKYLYIITGTSKGIGAAIAKELDQPSHHIIGISRTPNPDFSDRFEHKYFDLVDYAALPGLVVDIFFSLDQTEYASITLINNAGIIEPINTVDRCEANDFFESITINLLVPMILSSEFAKHLQEYTGVKRILNISSGAAKKPIEGWSSYCTSKTGLNMFTQCFGKEQAHVEDGIQVISMAPGVIDTPMQETIRGASKEVFPGIDRFLDLKENNALTSPSDVAKRIVDFLDNKFDAYPSGSVLDIRTID